jgi:hypothetical protein
MIDYLANDEAVRKVKEIDDQIKEENDKEVADGSKLTKLMFEQMLRGLYINQYN